MQRYFINEPLREPLTLRDRNQVYHIQQVMRQKPGETLIVTDSEGRSFQMLIETFDQASVTLKKNIALNPLKPAFHVTLAQALIRADHFAFAFEKAIELGANTVIPIQTARTLTINEATASTPNHRDTLTKPLHASFENPMALKSLDLSIYDHVFVAYEKAISMSIIDALMPVLPTARIMMIIGPEGGFTEEEITLLEHKGAIAVSLGSRILRSETAALYALSAVNLLLEVRD